MLLSEGLFCIQVISRFSFSDFPGKLTRVVGEGVPRVAAGSRLLQLTVKTKKKCTLQRGGEWYGYRDQSSSSEWNYSIDHHGNCMCRWLSNCSILTCMSQQSPRPSRSWSFQEKTKPTVALWLHQTLHGSSPFGMFHGGPLVLPSSGLLPKGVCVCVWYWDLVIRLAKSPTVSTLPLWLLVHSPKEITDSRRDLHPPCALWIRPTEDE